MCAFSWRGGRFITKQITHVGTGTTQQNSWRASMMRQLCSSWGWNEHDFYELDRARNGRQLRIAREQKCLNQ